MNAIPAGVEASLLEAGFTSTEVAILRRLLEHQALTLRELALRTAKSTGVLDQASKKLLQKNIIRKESINGHDRFTITSLDAILQWMEEDIRKKRDLMSRRQQTFESFIKSYEVDKKRPEITHFEGIEGLAKAYRKLLDCGQEITGFVPVFCSIEDHPLRDFMVEWFRQRHKRGIFSRVITHNTPLGRRYHSRDMFEYRQSLLIEEEQLPFTFEKLICGDTIACFNYTEKRAVLFRFPELAAMEKAMFESWWRQLQKKELPKVDAEVAAGEATPAKALASALKPGPSEVPFSIKTFSGLREFFVSRKSIAAFCGIALLSAGLTFYLYNYTRQLEFQRMQDTVKSIAATGTFQFEAKDLDALQVEKDWKKPEWGKVVKTLEKIRKTNPDVEYIYLIRKTKKDPLKAEFIADSHSLNPYANSDNDPSNDVRATCQGVVMQGDPSSNLLQWPGQPYPEFPGELSAVYQAPMAGNIYTDQWGVVVSGYAPVKDDQEKVVGVLAVDMCAQALDSRIASVFQPALYFIGLFLLFVLIRLTAFNRSLFTELWNALHIKRVLVIIACCTILSLAATYALYRFNIYVSEERIREKVLSIATMGAVQFDPKDLEQLHTEADIHKPEYAKIIGKLNEIRDVSLGVKYAYIIRPTSDPQHYEFVADADSLDPKAKKDLNGDGVINEEDHLTPPGEIYDMTQFPGWKDAMVRPVANIEVYSDQWGKFISGWAPIKDVNGKSVAVFGIDKFAADASTLSQENFSPLVWFIGFFLLFLAINLAFLGAMHRRFVKQVWDFFQLRKVLIVLTLTAEVAFGITFGLYQYMLRQTINEAGNRLMAIAATAAPQFNTKELDSIRYARDMKTVTYQHIFRQLNDVLHSNQDVMYVYILRSVDNGSLFEWVADPYSNYNVPKVGPDVNADGVYDEADENTGPSERYWINNPKAALTALQHPSYTEEFYSDQWGTWITGYAPIKDSVGQTHAILGADIDVSKIYEILNRKFVPWLWFSAGFSILMILFLLFRKQEKF